MSNKNENVVRMSDYLVAKRKQYSPHISGHYDGGDILHAMPLTRDHMPDAERAEWLAIRKEAGRNIDPETAAVFWTYAQTLDPYGIYPDLPEECRCVGREYFARSPGSDVWVAFEDLPKATVDALWERQWPELEDDISF